MIKGSHVVSSANEIGKWSEALRSGLLSILPLLTIVTIIVGGNLMKSQTVLIPAHPGGFTGSMSHEQETSYPW